MYLAYSLLTLAVFVVVSPYFLYQAVRYKKYIGSSPAPASRRSPSTSTPRTRSGFTPSRSVR
jgi:hypothetical protein